MNFNDRFKESLELYLKVNSGKEIEDANTGDLYFAICYFVREMIGPHWSNKNEGKKKYYSLSFEYQPGKLLEKNLVYLNIKDKIDGALKNMGISLDEIISFDKEIGIGLGGLGSMTDANLDSMTSLGFDTVAYGIRYEKGLLKHNLDKGEQIESPQNWLEVAKAWEYDIQKKYKITFKDFELEAKAFDYPYLGHRNQKVNPLRLWAVDPFEDIDMEALSSWDLKGAFEKYNIKKSLSSFLYLNEKTVEARKFRLSQEYFFISASIQDIISIESKKTKGIKNLEKNIRIEINDTHPILAIPEFIRLLKEQFNIPYKDSLKISKEVFTYTTYSVLEESFNVWEIDLINETIPQIMEPIKYIDREFKALAKDKGFSEDILNQLAIIKDNKVFMSNIAVLASRRVDLLTNHHVKLFNYSNLKTYSDIGYDGFYVRNPGVNQRRWLLKSNRELCQLIESLIGSCSKDNPQALEKLLAFEDDFEVLKKLSEIKFTHKENLSSYIYKNMGISINPYSIFDMQINRFHEYKRQLLNALRISQDYFLLKENSNYKMAPRTYFFAGKANPGYKNAKTIISFIHSLAKLINKDRFIQEKIRIIFFEDIGVDSSEHLIKATEVHESPSLSLLNTKSSSTLNFSINGAVTVGTNSGKHSELIEVLGDENFISFGLSSSEDILEENTGTYNARAQYYGNEDIEKLFKNFYKLSWSDFPFNFRDIEDMIFEKNDRYRIFRDLESYAQAHKKVEERYMNTNRWNKMALNCIAYSGRFSNDLSIRALENLEDG